MSTHEHSRRAHELVDAIKDGYTPDRADVDFLRSFLPELPKQMTLEEIVIDVRGAWSCTSGNDWGGDICKMDVSIEDWLGELHAQLKGLMDAPANTPAHPEFLETEADYHYAPAGTVAGKDGWLVWIKQKNGDWSCDGGSEDESILAQTGKRRVLRWGWTNEQPR